MHSRELLARYDYLKGNRAPEFDPWPWLVQVVALLAPLALLSLGAVFGWAFSGFRRAGFTPEHVLIGLLGFVVVLVFAVIARSAEAQSARSQALTCRPEGPSEAGWRFWRATQMA
jgi:hypothetical protein